jgi:hypothetical protein
MIVTVTEAMEGPSEHALRLVETTPSRERRFSIVAIANAHGLSTSDIEHEDSAGNRFCRNAHLRYYLTVRVRDEHQHAEALKRLEAGESCRTIGKTMGRAPHDRQAGKLGP